MIEGAMPKPLGDVARAFFLVMVAGGIALGWLHNRGRQNRRAETSGDGLDSDDSPHHGGWWSFGDADGGHDGDGGDGGH